ncbi:MAG TPA: 4-alpha-glucanotransferase, partial [Gemmatales bacterium]|nr:4-alpha-glucanotransferase [Gemmatales bacterium]
FRGFEAAWHGPAGAKTAEVGDWLSGPGLSFFRAVQEALGELPLVAEDLGEITPPVRVMLAELGLPGMRILQFAFDSDADNPFLPHHHVANTVVYTGTHDNDTTRGWYRQAEEGSKEYLKKYIGRAALGDHHAVWELIRLAWSSVAVLSVVPLQDILELGTSARMNLPGQGHGNWDWRLHPEAPLRAAFDRLAEFSHLYARCPPAPPKAPEEAPQAAGHPENSNGAPQS